MSTTTLSPEEIAAQEVLANAVRALDPATVLVPEVSSQYAAVLGLIGAVSVQLSEVVERQRAQGVALAALIEHGQATLPSVAVQMT